MKKTIKYLHYPPERDVLFVFGAGTSHPDGVPLQRDILPIILNDKEIANSEIGKIVIQFIKDNFVYDEANNEKIEYARRNRYLWHGRIRTTKN